jgi:hypothetical protein
MKRRIWKEAVVAWFESPGIGHDNIWEKQEKISIKIGHLKAEAWIQSPSNTKEEYYPLNP